MPRKKTAVFVTVITALLVVMVLSVAMSVHHYEKTVLITLDAAGEQAAENETGLAEIRRQLEADKADASTGTMFWNGSVCVTKYRAWGGRTTTYYVCPYLSAVSTETIGDTPKEWTVSLSFAMCATQGEELVNFNKKFAVRDIELHCRAGNDAAILSAAYNDMDMTDINGDLLSYTFRDKEELTTDTSVYAKLMMVSKKSLNQIEAEAKEGTDEKDSVMVNWAFRLEEDGRLVNNFDGVLVEISPNTVDFQPKLDEFEAKITPKTKAVIVNTPNNPTGVVYSEETIRKMAEIMEKKQNEYGTEIYLISDEPYRELAYDGVDVPYLTRYYANTIVGYSYSKSLSLPGERIGYLVIPDDVKDSETLIAAANVANRILGFVNAPTLQQKVVARCLHEKTDISYYNRNRETLYQGLIECGFECVKPQGAFYLFMKTPIKDEKTFCQEAKKYNLLLVPGSSFGCAGYVRIAYCVAYETIVNALPKFKELAKEYQLG